MIDLSTLEIWFVTGSQHLYGDGSAEAGRPRFASIVQGLAQQAGIPVRIVFKPVLTGPDAIHDICQEANRAPNCIGLITWMHTFSPAKMWIAGLRVLKKPFVHLHTQFNRDIPWSTIDMDFMNLNQSAHGDREFGFICSRMRLARTVVVGHWQDKQVQRAAWHVGPRGCRLARCAAAKIARFGDNMRQVAVTEGDKVEAQVRFGYPVNGYGMGDLAAAVNGVSDADVDRLCGQYDEEYVVAEPLRKNGPRRAGPPRCGPHRARPSRVSRRRRVRGFTDTFENLHGLKQLPGVAAQRLMADGYGFGAEGDWKTAALVRAMKVMAAGLKGGTSFMEDYTYHLDPANAAGAWRRTCWRSARRSPPAGRRWRFIRSGSAARKTRCDWCSTRRRARPSTRRSSTWAAASACWSTRSTWSHRPSRCQSFRSREPSGNAPRFPNRRRRLDPRRRPAPHQLQPGRHHGTARSVRRNGRRRARGHRRRHLRADVQKNPPLERGVLQLSVQAEFGASLRQVRHPNHVNSRQSSRRNLA